MIYGCALSRFGVVRYTGWVKVLGLDIGEKRIGFAVGDTDALIAMPLCVMPAQEVFAHSRAFCQLVKDHEPELLVAGLPLSLDGQEDKQALRVKGEAEGLAAFLQLPLVFQDERLSSAQAKRYLRQAGFTEKEMRGKIDKLAASLVLEAYLDAHYAKPQGS